MWHGPPAYLSRILEPATGSAVCANRCCGKAFGMEVMAQGLIAFVRDHQAWAAPLVLVLAFGESLAFISLLIPAWGALVSIGALIGVSGISFWPVWIAGGIGAGLGDGVPSWSGSGTKKQVRQWGPCCRFPETRRAGGP